jgi:hypothetical protein
MKSCLLPSGYSEKFCDRWDLPSWPVVHNKQKLIFTCSETASEEPFNTKEPAPVDKVVPERPSMGI